MNWKNLRPSADQTQFIHQGVPVFSKRFKQVLKFHSPGLAPVLDDTGAYHITINGGELYKNRYTRTFGFYCNRASVIEDDHWFHIDESGKRAYGHSFAWTGNYQEELCTVRDHQGHYFHIDLHGQRTYEEDYNYTGDYKDGIACARLPSGLYQHIDREGNPINGKLFLDLGIFHKGFATAKDQKGWFHIDMQGNELYQERYLIIEPFYNGFALVTTHENNKIVIDENGLKALTL
jgi:hypothetical protein